MRTTGLMARMALLVTAGVWLSTTAACGGAQVPEHDGYPDRWTKGWKKPQKVQFDEDFESELDGELSYPKRRRVRWFAVDLPEDGSIDVQLQAAPLGLQGGEADLVDVEDPFDVGLEIYNENFKVLARADREEDDVGERKKSRTLQGLRKGRYLVHIFVQRRLDEAEYTLRIKFKPGSADPETNFPTHLAFVEDLAVVPAFDDAPAPEAPSRPRCRGSKCKKPTPSSERKDEVKAETTSTPAATADVMRARVIVVRGISSGGSTITLNRGSDQGVQAGWKGEIVTSSGKTLPSGDFTITSVKSNSSTAKVNLSQDAIKQAGRAILRAP